LLQFSPFYDVKADAATSSGKGEAAMGATSYHYKTVGDLLQRKEGLPKVYDSIPGSPKKNQRKCTGKDKTQYLNVKTKMEIY